MPLIATQPNPSSLSFFLSTLVPWHVLLLTERTVQDHLYNEYSGFHQSRPLWKCEEWTLAWLGHSIPPSHQVARSVGDWGWPSKSDSDSDLGFGLGLTRTSIGHKAELINARRVACVPRKIVECEYRGKNFLVEFRGRAAAAVWSHGIYSTVPYDCSSSIGSTLKPIYTPISRRNTLALTFFFYTRYYRRCVVRCDNAHARVFRNSSSFLD